MQQQQSSDQGQDQDSQSGADGEPNWEASSPVHHCPYILCIASTYILLQCPYRRLSVLPLHPFKNLDKQDQFQHSL